MPEYGLTEKGFKRKPYTQVVADKEERARFFFGEDVDLSEGSPLALYIKTDAWEEGKLWDELENVYFSAYIDDAEGKQLDGLVKKLGIKRKPAQKAVGFIGILGKPGAAIFAGTQVMTEANVVFCTLADVVLNDVGSVVVGIEALESGKAGNVGAERIDRLFVAVDGIEKVWNPEPTSGGSSEETDEELRERYYRSLARRGKATCPAVEAALLEIESVQDAFVIENTSMETINGVPPKSIAPYVYDGDENDIIKAILDTKAGGIQSYGDIVVEVADNRGRLQKIGYTRAKSKDVYVKIELVRNSSFKPEAEKEIVTAVVKYIGGIDADSSEYKGLGLGMNVMRSKLVALADGAGVDDVFVRLSEDGIHFSENNIHVPSMEIASTDYSKVEIL